VDFVPVDVPTGGGTGRIAYTYQPMSGPAVHEIYLINMDGTENEKTSAAPFGINHHHWSPDGHRFAAVGYVGVPDTWSIYVFDAGGANLERLTTAVNVWDNEPSWSPDGARIAFGRIYPDDNFREEVWMMNADGGGQHWIGVYGENPGWSPDGARLVYHSSRSGTYDIYTCNADGTLEEQLTFTASYNEVSPDWSPGGSQIVYYSDLDGDHEIYVMNPDGSDPLQLTHNEVGDYQPLWSPDGSLITFSSGLPGYDHWEVYIMNANGTNVRRVTNTPPTATAINPCWQPPDTTAVPVYLADFSCARTEGAVRIAWTVQDAAAAADFRLVADKDGRQRNVRVYAAGARRFEAIDSDPSLTTGGTILYRLFARESDGGWSLLRTGKVGIGTRQMGARLSGIYPNPFNPRTTISFTLDFPQHVTVEVHDTAGRLVKALAHQKYPAGDHELNWGGRNAAGGEVASGVYFLRFKAGKTSDSRKLILIK
jgi:Tol biopolymer transport system component